MKVLVHFRMQAVAGGEGEAGRLVLLTERTLV